MLYISDVQQSLDVCRFPFSTFVHFYLESECGCIQKNELKLNEKNTQITFSSVVGMLYVRDKKKKKKTLLCSWPTFC